MVRIKAEGKRGSGKTVILEKIRTFLEKKGYSVSLIGEHELEVRKNERNPIVRTKTVTESETQ